MKEIVTKYTLEQILVSKKFANDVDVINALFEDGEYTIEEVEETVKKWKGKKVN